MKKIYLKLQLKSVLKSFPAILVITLITIFAIAVAGITVIINKTNKEEAQKVSVGVVGDVEDTFFDIAIYALEHMDSSQFYVDVEKLDKDEAVNALKSREISGFLDIPDGYINDIFWGRNTPAKYITLSKPNGFGTTISCEIAEIVSEIVGSSQVAMYSMQEIAHDENIKNLDKKTNELMMIYIQTILNRKLLYDITSLGIADSLSYGGYYICGLILFFLLLWGISCNKIFSSRSIEFSKLLKSRKIKTSWQIICEYVAYLFITVLTFFIISVICGIILEFKTFGIPELSGADVQSCILFMIKILPVIIMITIMQFAFYELVPHTVGSIIAQFVIALGLGYISGCFYPICFFPEAIQTIAYCLPSGIGFGYIRKIMSDSVPIVELLIIILYIFIFSIAAVCVRNYRIAGGIK